MKRFNIGRLASVGGASLVLLLGCEVPPSDDVRTTENAVTGTKQVSELKSQRGIKALQSNDPARREFRKAFLAENGLPPDENAVDTALAEDPELAARLDADQLGAWRQAITESAAALRIVWDSKLQTPARMELGIHVHGADGYQAKAELDARMQTILRRLYKMDGSDRLVPVEDQPLVIRIPGVESQIRAHRLRYGRERHGLPVFQDWLEIGLRVSEFDDTQWEVQVSARWDATLERVAGSPVLDAHAAIARLRAEASVTDADTAEAKLGYYTLGDDYQLSYEIRQRDADGAPRLSYVSATNGTVLSNSRQVAHDGSLQLKTGFPYDGNTKAYRPLKNVAIYENASSQPRIAGCTGGGPTPQLRGDPATRKGQTDANGTYGVLAVVDPSDTNWVVDFRGRFVTDITRASDMTRDVIGDTAFRFTDSDTAYQSNRGEAYYLLDYGAATYSALAVNQYEPLGFSLTGFSDRACDSPVGGDDCASGSSNNGCIELESYGADGFVHPATAFEERRVREVLFHEQNHTLRFKSAGALCDQCDGSPTVDGPECSCFEEGRADFGAITMGRLEKSRPEFLPTKSYDKFSGGGAVPYESAAIWTATYVDYFLRAGLTAIPVVNWNLYQIDLGTRMVGVCTNPANIATCPANSYYRLLLANDDFYFFGKWRNTEEISQAFHSHVFDADRKTSGFQSYPWADETPNRVSAAPYIHTLASGAVPTIIGGGQSGSGALRLDSGSDNDTFTFFGVASKPYAITTSALATGVDTVVQVLSISGSSETVLASNDDCAPPARHSCLTFTPPATGYYKIRITPYPNTSTGYSATYQLSVQRTTDDFGDDLAAAAPFVSDDVMHNDYGTFESAADRDVFRITVPAGSNTIYYTTCFGGSVGKVELLDNTGTVRQGNYVGCGTRQSASVFGPANYYLRLSPGWGPLGKYGLAVSLSRPDIDVDSTPANAFTLSSAVSGRMLAARFETATDEDWFRIEAEEGRFYQIDAVTIDPGADTVMELYGPSNTLYGRRGTIDQLPDTSGQGLGHFMMRDDDGGLSGSGSRIHFWAPVAGTYYVRVRPFAATSSASGYHLVFEDTTLSHPWPIAF